MTMFEELMASQMIRIKVVAFVHFVLIGNAMLGMWLPGAYLFYNFLFIISMFWTLHCKESIDAIHTALIINACSIFFDFISIIVFFNYMNGWVVAFAIINLVARPFSCLLLHREFTERSGTTQIFPTNQNQQQRSYQDIDRPIQTLPQTSPLETTIKF